MKKIMYLMLLMCYAKSMVCIAQAPEITSQKIGLMVEGLYEEESKAIEKFLVSQEKFESVKINDSLLIKGQLESLDFTHIWIHQLSGNH